jgi:hypothetical protein
MHLQTMSLALKQCGQRKGTPAFLTRRELMPKTMSPETSGNGWLLFFTSFHLVSKLAPGFKLQIEFCL